MTLAYQLIRFAGVGGLATLIHAAVYAALVAKQAAPFAANLAAFGLAFLISLIGHYRYSFASSAPWLAASLRFLLVALVGLALNAFGVWLVDQHWQVHPNWALVMMLLIVPPVSFLLSRLWAFAQP